MGKLRRQDFFSVDSENGWRQFYKGARSEDLVSKEEIETKLHITTTPKFKLTRALHKSQKTKKLIRVLRSKTEFVNKWNQLSDKNIPRPIDDLNQWLEIEKATRDWLTEEWLPHKQGKSTHTQRVLEIRHVAIDAIRDLLSEKNIGNVALTDNTIPATQYVSPLLIDFVLQEGETLISYLSAEEIGSLVRFLGLKNIFAQCESELPEEDFQNGSFSIRRKLTPAEAQVKVLVPIWGFHSIHAQKLDLAKILDLVLWKLPFEKQAMLLTIDQLSCHIHPEEYLRIFNQYWNETEDRAIKEYKLIDEGHSPYSKDPMISKWTIVEQKKLVDESRREILWTLYQLLEKYLSSSPRISGNPDNLSSQESALKDITNPQAETMFFKSSRCKIFTIGDLETTCKTLRKQYEKLKQEKDTFKAIPAGQTIRDMKALVAVKKWWDDSFVRRVKQFFINKAEEINAAKQPQQTPL